MKRPGSLAIGVSRPLPAELTRCCRIQHPRHLAMRGTYVLCGILVGVVLSFDDRTYSVRLVTAGHQKKHVSRCIQEWRGEGQAIRWRLGCPHWHDETLLLVQCSRVWEERSGMPFRSHTELDQVKAGYAIGAEDALHLANIIPGGSMPVGLIRAHAVYLLLSNRHLAQKRFLRQAEIALRVIYRDAAFIAPENLQQCQSIWLRYGSLASKLYSFLGVEPPASAIVKRP